MKEQKRSCGDCTACCVVFELTNISKAAGVPCRYLRSENGVSCKDGACSIHKNRPEECSGFSCNWLRGLYTKEDRPDKIGAVFCWQSWKDMSVLTVYELSPGALNTLRLGSLIQTDLSGQKNAQLVTVPFPEKPLPPVDFSKLPRFVLPNV